MFSSAPHFLVALLSFLMIVESQRTPTISFISSNITKAIGSTINMHCSVLYATEFPTLWLKLPRGEGCDIARSKDIRSQESDTCTPIPLSHGAALVVRDNRFSLRYDTASSTYTLQIKDVQSTDEAVYQCEVIVGNTNKVTRHVALTVSEPPAILDNTTRSVVVVEDSSAQLNCYATGAPPPLISWRRENNAILPTGGVLYRGNVLKIHSIQKEDRGTYYCVADNGVGKIARRHVVVEVEFPPVVISTTKSIAQAIGYGVELVCHVEAYPAPSITWLKENIVISSNQNYAIDAGFATTDDFTETTVRVRHLDYSQIGKYTCRAQNKLGTNEKTLEVIESYSPNCVTGICENYFSESNFPTRNVYLILLSAVISLIKNFY
ncbi:lachesin [Lepeophtheirus salmonis]|uniref:lachesin n=1 Tax=Lepeophtheirus salmonis TaxID=72036 RepID=UPI001AE20363|nr:lachesin-like [Lepeophtheirus salmonis]